MRFLFFLTFSFLQALLLPERMNLLHEDPDRAGGCTHIYEFHDVEETMPPKGYKPVYLCHYGRHGARREFDDGLYAGIIHTLEQAQEGSFLSQKGDSLLTEMRTALRINGGMPMELLPRGQYEQRQIARRLYARYPSIFRNGCKRIRVKSTDVTRVLVSMACFTGELASIQPDLDFDIFSGIRYYDTLYNSASDYHKRLADEPLKTLLENSPNDTVEIFNTLFIDAIKGRALIDDPETFQKNIWLCARVGGAMGLERSLFRFLPDEVVYRWWNYYNCWIYLRQCNSVEFGPIRMPRCSLLVNDIVNSVEDALKNGTYAVDVKFGHDFPLLALCGYFGLKGVGQSLSIEEIPFKWHSPYIPFSSNLQLVFYKKKGSPQTLVKFVYNDKEQSITDEIRPFSGNYYRWEDVREYAVSRWPAIVENPVSLSNELQWEQLSEGMEYSTVHLRLFNSAQNISLLRFEMDKHPVDIVSRPGEAADSTSLIAVESGATAAINGSYFNMNTFQPIIYVLDDGIKAGTPPNKANRRHTGVLAIGKGGTVSIFDCPPEDFKNIPDRFRDALGAGPVLVSNGEIQSSYFGNSKFSVIRHPRTFIGIDGNMVYFVVIDGRFPGRADGMTLEETASVARMLGLSDALNLDGGGSCTLWIKGKGVISIPCDNHMFDHFGQRIVPNVITVR